jgi:predicted Na+-dependent transporter
MADFTLNLEAPFGAREEKAKSRTVAQEPCITRRWANDFVILVDVAAHGGVIRSEYSIVYGAVAFIFLVSGLSLPFSKLRQNVTNWRLHIIVQGISFAVIPAIMLGK